MPAWAFNITENGQGIAAIILPEHPSAQEALAAHDLRAYIEKISGAFLPIAYEPVGTGRPLILIGATGFARKNLGDILSHKHLGNDGYVIRTIDNRVVIAEVSAPYPVLRDGSGDGTRHGVFGFLELLGCRFFAFHNDGEHIPRQGTISVGKLDVIAKPDFVRRRFGWSIRTSRDFGARYQVWAVKNKLGGLRMSHSHNYSCGLTSIIPSSEKQRMFKKHPEYFPLLPDEQGHLARTPTGQLCLSNPDVQALAVQAARKYLGGRPYDGASAGYSLSPNDSGGWCQCDACKAWDDPDKKVGLATRVLRFNNIVAEALAKEFPDRRFAYYAEYNNMPGPPVREDGTVALKADPAVLPVFVNIYCLIHDVNDPTCAVNAEYRRRLDEWGKVSKDMYAYEWYMWTSTYSLPINYVIGPRIRYYRDHGVTGFYGEVLGLSPDNMLSLYITAKMLWDSDQDPNALLDEFYQLYFQESAQPMRSYYKLLNSFAQKSEQHGYRFLALRPNTKRNVEDILNVTRVKQLRALMTKAEALATTDLIRRRLQREAQALQHYENQARVQHVYSQFLKEPTAKKAQELRNAIDRERRHYAGIGDVVMHQSKRHEGWLVRMEKQLATDFPRKNTPKRTQK